MLTFAFPQNTMDRGRRLPYVSFDKSSVMRYCQITH